MQLKWGEEVENILNKIAIMLFLQEGKHAREREEYIDEYIALRESVWLSGSCVGVIRDITTSAHPSDPHHLCI